jgi:hypothetical protein
MSKGRYKAAFILPLATEKVLGDMGWEFRSLERLPKSTEEFLREALHLKLSESFLGVASYENERLKANVTLDDAGEIEEVYLKLYSIDAEQLSSIFYLSHLPSFAELFFPPEKNITAEDA